jgi:hypothetical protein
MSEFKSMCAQFAQMCHAFYELTRSAEKALIAIVTEVENKK